MKKFFLIVAVFFNFSCAKNKPEVPKGLISKEKMVSILMDVYIAESKINNFHLAHDSSSKLFKEFEKRIFEKHGVDDSTYFKSYHYYIDELKSMDEIYGAMVDSLSLRERLIKEDNGQKNQDIKEKNDHDTDSIK